MLHKLIDSPYEILSTHQISDLEPNLAPIFKYGFYQKGSLSISNPEKLVLGMVDLFIENGGQYQQFPVESINTQDDAVTLNGTSGALNAGKIIIATGAWSKKLAKQLGDNIPLDAERGYHLMFPQSTGELLKRSVLNGENSFVLAPMETGMRLTSQIEFAGIDAEPNYGRVRSLVPTAKRMLPNLDTNEKSVDGWASIVTRFIAGYWLFKTVKQRVIRIRAPTFGHDIGSDNCKYYFKPDN